MMRRSLFPIWLLTLAIVARGLVPWVHGSTTTITAEGDVLLAFCGTASPAVLAKAASISPWKQDLPRPDGPPSGSASKICPVCVVASAAAIASPPQNLTHARGIAVRTAWPATATIHTAPAHRYDARGPPAPVTLSI